MIDVMFYEAFKEEVDVIGRFLPNSINARFTDKTIQASGDKNPPSELISIRTQSHIPNHWSKGVKGILTRSRGHDHLLDFQRECKAEISLGFLDDYCSRAVAEQALLTAMTLLRKFKKQIKNFDTFNRDGLTGLECRGRKVLVAGVGRIGSEIIDIAKGMRMEVKGFDVDRSLSGLNYVTLEEGLAWAEVVFCALPLTEETVGMFDYQTLQKVRPGSIFINIARGDISPLEDLKRLMDDKILGGIGLDVFPQEPTLAHHLRNGQNNKTSAEQLIIELSEKDQVLFTPHNAFNTQEALEKKASLSVAAITQFIERGTFPCPVLTALSAPKDG